MNLQTHLEALSLSYRYHCSINEPLKVPRRRRWYCMIGMIISSYNIYSLLCRWKQNLYPIRDGIYSGPIVLFDKSGAAMVISPFNHFMAASMWHNSTGCSLNFGITGKVDNIPPGYTMDTIIYCSEDGINDVSIKMGCKLIRSKKKPLLI